MNGAGRSALTGGEKDRVIEPVMRMQRIRYHDLTEARARSEPRRMRKPVVMSLFLLGWLLCFLYGTAAVSVNGHAYVTASNPEQGERLSHMPEQVSLTFNERVDNSLFELAVLDEQGRNVAMDAELDGKRVQLSAALTTEGDGLYTVHYRVISLDGHPIGGTYVFAVGTSVVSDGSTNMEEAAGGHAAHMHDSNASLVEDVVRGAYLGGLLLLTGSVWWRSRGVASPIRAGYLSAAVLLLTVIMFGMQYGSWLVSQGAGGIASFAFSAAGWLWTLQMLLLLAGIWLSAGSGTVSLLWACVLLAVESLQGHAVRGAAGLGVIADFVHLGAAALWTAGIAGLIWSWLRERSLWQERAVQFTRTAFWSIVLLSISGLVQSALIWGGRWEELPYTPWGRMALAKGLLTAAVIATASILWLLMRKRMRRTAVAAFAVDVLLMCVLVGTAAAMSYHTPAPVSEAMHWHVMDDGVHMQLKMEPLKLGENDAVVTVWANDDALLPEHVQLQLVYLDQEELEPLDIQLVEQTTDTEEGAVTEGSVPTVTYTAERALIPMSGRWEAVLLLMYEDRDSSAYHRTFRIFANP